MAAKAVERTPKLDSLALNLYKHSQFAPKLINEKVQSNDYSQGRVLSYFLGMKNYIKTGNRNLKQAPNAFYDAIQEYVDTHVAQLTPKETERCQGKGKYYRQPKTPVVTYKEEPSYKQPKLGKINISKETMETIQNVGKVSCMGIKVGSNIKLFEDEKVLNGYVQCLNDLKPQLTDDIEWEVIDLSYKKKA